MTDSEKDLASLISKIEQLEERQNITAKYAVRVKRQLDGLTEKFNNLQQRIEEQSALSNGLNSAKPTNGLVSSEAVAVVSVNDSAESLMLNNSTNIMRATSAEVEVNADVDGIETDEIDGAIQQERNHTAFSHEEFKMLRMAQLLEAYGDLLLLKAYLAEEKSQEAPLSTEEFWIQYNNGKRDFTGINLAGADLSRCASGANLSRANLTRAKLSGNWNSQNLSEANLSGASLSRASLTSANLSGANLSGANLSSANLSGVNLKGADLSYANLSGANLSEANLDDTYLHQAKLEKARLERTTLKKANLTGANLNAAYLREANLSEAALYGEANLSMANLSGANLSSADLRGADLRSTNLEKANLKDANIRGANLVNAKLSGALMPDGTTHE